MLDNSCKTSRQLRNAFVFPSCLMPCVLDREGQLFIVRGLYAFENSHSPTYPQLVTIYVLKIARSADLIHFTTSVLSWERAGW